jgi:hypothetical protein
MKSNNFFEKQIRNVSCVTGLLTWNEVCHLGKSIHHHNIESNPLCVIGNPNTKSMLIASNGFSGMGNG